MLFILGHGYLTSSIRPSEGYPSADPLILLLSKYFSVFLLNVVRFREAFYKISHVKKKDRSGGGELKKKNKTKLCGIVE